MLIHPTQPLNLGDPFLVPFLDPTHLGAECMEGPSTLLPLGSPSRQTVVGACWSHPCPGCPGNGPCKVHIYTPYAIMVAQHEVG